MLRNRLYYAAKPRLPWRLRMALRRLHARRIRRRCGAVWPILESAGRQPEGWPGWPEGKQFALVLTHDVESPIGLNRVKQLAELEMQMGFRSSFNFIPEGHYTVPSSIRTWLVDNGFEVGIHDLYHNGKLFASRNAFRRHAPKINHYLDAWNAVGFRSGFMMSELDWLHELNIQYDASTFDTDLFEPQPDGIGTIFPFFVQRSEIKDQRGLTSDLRPLTSGASRHGYVELPYTIPQDSTLFLLLRESTIDIWRTKLDWVAQHGGMVLLDTHPDYMALQGAPRRACEYPYEYYEQLLRYIRSQYPKAYWHALPREVASLMRDNETDRGIPQSGLHFDIRRRQPKPKIWIDLDNTPHVLFFEPILDELRSRGFPLLVTARDAFQVCELADKKGIPYVKIGRHHGKNRLLKAGGLLYRALQLAPVVVREKPALAVSHGARSQLLLSNWLLLTSLLIEDYEYSRFPWMMRPTWVMAPTAIPKQALAAKDGRILQYPGIKEDVYVWKLKPDPRIQTELGLRDSELIVTVRPPATEAHYHNPESEALFERFMDRACQKEGIRIVLLPRNQRQTHFVRQRWPEWFKKDKTVIPRAVIDGLNLMWHSDLVVSGGGTMNREAAALGVPVYSIFRGRIGAVDRQLSLNGRLVLIESLDDVDRKLRLEKRPRRPLGEVTSRDTLYNIVHRIEEIAQVSAR